MTNIVENFQFAICIDNTDYPVSLEPHKIYWILPDKDAQAEGSLRVVDEGGEDYLYPAEYFVPVILSQATKNFFQKGFDGE